MSNRLRRVLSARAPRHPGEGRDPSIGVTDLREIRVLDIKWVPAFVRMTCWGMRRQPAYRQTARSY